MIPRTIRIQRGAIDHRGVSFRSRLYRFQIDRFALIRESLMDFMKLDLARVLNCE